MSALSWMLVLSLANIFLGSRMLFDVSLTRFYSSHQDSLLGI